MAGKSKQVGSMSNEALARQLLEAMAKDGKMRGARLAANSSVCLHVIMRSLERNCYANQK